MCFSPNKNIPEKHYWAVLDCAARLEEQMSNLFDEKEEWDDGLYLEFNKYIQSHKHLIQYSGLGLNRCKRVSDRLEKDLTQCATKYNFNDFADSLASAIDQTEALKTSSH